MVDVTVKSDDVDRIIRNIRTHADAKAIRREMFQGLNSVTKPVRAEMMKAIPAALPSRGGLASRMQAAVTSSTSAKGGKYAGISMRFRSRGYDIRTLTGGRIRHPLYGNRRHWFTQTAGVTPSEFTGEFEANRPRMQRAVGAVMDDIARRITSA